MKQEYIQGDFLETGLEDHVRHMQALEKVIVLLEVEAPSDNPQEKDGPIDPELVRRKLGFPDFAESLSELKKTFPHEAEAELVLLRQIESKVPGVVSKNLLKAA